MAIITPTYSVTQLKGLQTNLFGMSNNLVAMSHEDSLDDETKRLLAEVDTDDSKESVKVKDKRKNTDIEWETNKPEDNDEEW